MLTLTKLQPVHLRRGARLLWSPPVELRWPPRASRPPLDLRPVPDLGTDLASAHSEDRLWECRIVVLVIVDSLRVPEAEPLGDLVRADQEIDIDLPPHDGHPTGAGLARFTERTIVW